MSSSAERPRPRRSAVVRFFRALHHVIFHASRQGRCAEIAGWSNALASLGIGAGLFALYRSVGLAVGATLVIFVLLRAALANRSTIWVAASFGTLAVSATAGGLSWLFAHVLESLPTAPPIAAILGAVGAAIVPAWAYGRLAQRRAENVRDSLFDPVSVPSSRT
jgi:hypothetical protein